MGSASSAGEIIGGTEKADMVGAKVYRRKGSLLGRYPTIMQTELIGIEATAQLTI